MTDVRRLRFEYVQPYACKTSVREGFQQHVHTLNEPAPRKVNEVGATLHLAEAFAINQTRGFRREWRVNRNEVGQSQELIQRRQGPPQRRRSLSRYIRIVGQNLHLEGADQPG